MEEWAFAQARAAEKLARHHVFSVMKQQEGAEIEFVITVKESATPTDPRMRFFAQADKQTNQDSVPYTPSAWGDTLLTALAECIVEIHRFPFRPLI